MKKIQRVTSLLLVLACLVSVLAVVSSGTTSTVSNSGASSAASDDSDVRYTKKIVSVLYDNSGSMQNSVVYPNRPATEAESVSRQHYASYALQMLMSMLSDRDELVVTPMNVPTGSLGAPEIDETTYKTYSVKVDLSSSDRDGEIRRVMSESLIAKTPYGGTPSNSIDFAIKNLTAKGLMDSQNLAATPKDTEHWLVILTDGAFSGCTNDNDKPDIPLTVQMLNSKISNYPALKTIFIGFSGDAPNLTGTSLTQNYPFTSYVAPDAASLTHAMQSVANQLSGRYMLDPALYTVDGNKVKVHIDRLDFSLRNISFIAQSCNAELDSATYEGKAMDISHPCEIIPLGDLGSKANIRNGCSAVINGNKFFSGGTLTLEFSAPVTKENLSIMAEPALTIKSYVERLDGSNWVLTDEQYINANLVKDNKLRVGYDVYEQATGKKIDINTIFDDVVSSVTYAKNSYAIGEEIPLVTGNNEIAVSVSVMDGAYKMYSTVRCIIEEDPKNYRIDANVADKISYYDKCAYASYTIYADGQKLNSLDSYDYEATVTAPDGSTATFKKGASRELSEDNGVVSLKIDAVEGKYGTYTVKFKVYNEFRISREANHTLEYKQPEITVNPTGTDRLNSLGSKAQMEFEILADGTRLEGQDLKRFTSEAKAYNPDGSEAEVKLTVGTTSVICSFTVTQYGKSKVEFSASDGKGLSADAEFSVGCYPASFEVKGTHPDKLPSKNTKAEFTYVCYIDGKQMTEAELEKYITSLSATEFDGTKFPISFSIVEDGASGGKITATLDLSSKTYGVYDIKLEAFFSDDYSESYEHSLSYYPESIALISGGGISLTEYQLTVNDKESVWFELSLDTRPSSFLNKLFEYKLTVDGVDVTAYATADSKKLIYVPKAEHFGNKVSVGDKTVTLTVTSPEFPNLTGTVSSTVTVTPTIYSVEPFEYGNKVVDRFKIDESKAALYFTVLRDGVPLSTAELEEALANKTLTLKDKSGVFSWQFWSPAGKSVSVEEIDGTPVVAYKVRDDIPVVGSFLAMLIFNGNKTIEAKYASVSATDAVKFKASGAWSYIWRILVILWIIHTVFYIIGFFNGKCKSLPTGVVVTLDLAARARGPVSLSAETVNYKFLERYGWHITRYFASLLFLIPGLKRKYWYHQKPRMTMTATVSLDNDGNSQFTFENTVARISSPPTGGFISAELIAAFRRKVEEEKYPPDEFDGPVITGDLQSFFNYIYPIREYEPGTPAETSNYYGEFSPRTKRLVRVIYFIEK
jgi:hypothetical protein